MKSDDTDETEKVGRGNISAEIVLETAAKLFYERGYDRTSMNEIAAALGVTKPSLYYYYPSKGALLLACIHEAGLIFNSKVDQIAEAQMSPGDKVTAIFRAYADALRSNIHRVLILADRRALSDEGVQVMAKAKGRINTVVERLIQEAIDTGEFREVDPRQAANAAFGMFNWMAVWRGEAAFRDSSIDEAFIDFALHGLKGCRK